MSKKPIGNVHGVTVATHFPKSDKNNYGDYYDVTVDVRGDGWDGHMDYGDQYHDNGQDKAEGYVDALKLIYGDKLPVIKYYVADREDY